MYIQGLQQLFKEASNAVMVKVGFSDSKENIRGDYSNSYMQITEHSVKIYGITKKMKSFVNHLGK